MSLVCAQCARVNPNEAAYCFYDGAALAGRAGGPINAGSAPFPNQFVFPNGQACRNFDQLAVACQQHWPQAIDLLKQGFLGSFFGGLGRVDLAMAAQEAVKFPDIDRGLDQLLAKLPTQAVQEPKLQAEPSEINLGVLKIGQDRASEIHLTNLGMRLVYGTVTSDCKWLTVGEGAGHSEKLFQFGSDTVIPIHVRGQHLRAGSKPNEGHLIVDSNGGTVTVTVKVDVPITPYAGGLFAGATTPRQIAEKAKATPKDAAPAFESGGIAKWYASNGWAYPVQGPTMSGMGAIQQFFEALGVAKAPKVDFAPKTLDLQGAVGKTVEATIEITTAERKVVYGWATSSVDWIEVGQTKLSGKSATVPITIRVPSPCPPKLETTLQLIGNGGQRESIPIKVKIAGGKAGVALRPSEAEIQLAQDVPAMPKSRSSVEAPSPLPTPNMMLPTPATSGSPFSFEEPAAAGGADPSPFAVTESSPMPMPKSRSDSGSSSDISKPKAGSPLIVRLLLYLLPLAMLFVVILVLLIHDFFFATARITGGGTDVTQTGPDMKEIDPRPHIMIRHNEGTKDGENDDHMTFAVHKINPNDKDEPPLKLNYYVTGAGNSTMLAIDDLPEMVMGHTATGNWIEKKSQKAGKFGDGRSRTFKFTRGNIEVIQTVTLEPSDPDPNIPGEKKRLLNTCLARYKITNKDKKPHIVGMRILIDGSIGEKDDVPFTIPGIPGVVTTFKDLKGKEVPDFVECMENADIAKPGTVVRIGLKISDKFEAPDRFLLTRYPEKSLGGYKKYDVPIKPFIGEATGDGKTGADSCAVMYWDKKPLGPGEWRQMGFTYGLGSVTVGDGGRLALTVGGRMFKDGELTVVALVADEKAKTATLDLPAGLEHIDVTKKTQPIEKTLREGRPSPVTWQVRATGVGEHVLTVTTDSGLKNQRKIKINAQSLFN